MVKMKVKRVVITVLIVILCFLLQCTLFQSLTLAMVKPNLILIAVVSLAIMKGPKTGIWIGFLAGLLVDIQFGEVIGFYALLFLLIGFLNGLFEQMYFDDDITLPLILITVSEILYEIGIYLCLFLLHGKFNFMYYFGHIIIPELIYTIVATLVLYPIILYVNRKLDTAEKRSASKFV